jgi:hypothetical protein
VSPTTSYVKGSPLTSLTPPNSNITAAAKVEMRSFFINANKSLNFIKAAGRSLEEFRIPFLAAKA